MRSLPSAADRRSAGTAFSRALVVNVIAGCTDAHAKNNSLMLERRSVRLAPLYDLLSYAAYSDGSASIDSAMSVGGDYRLRRISAAKLERAGAMFGVDAAEAAEIVDTTRKGLRPAVADELLLGLRKLPLALT